MQIDTAKIIIKPTRVYYLKMEEPPNERLTMDSSISFVQLVKPIDPVTYLKYYEIVGFKLNWLDRLVMPKDQLGEKINSLKVHIYVMKVEQHDAGFLELVQEADYVELLYFGLLPDFIGKGLGKYFLHWSIHKAWSYNPKWIQLNTCELDHANALPTYRRLGFNDYKMAMEDRRVFVSNK
jgi:GNAT superfamily N-acetyltransferase